MAKPVFNVMQVAEICNRVQRAQPQNRKRVRENIAESHETSEPVVCATVAHETIRFREAAQRILEMKAPRGKREQWEAAIESLDEEKLEDAMRQLEEVGACEALQEIGDVYRVRRPDVAIRAYAAAGMEAEVVRVLFQHRNAGEEIVQWLLKIAKVAVE